MMKQLASPDAEDTKTRIVEAAGSVFAEKGFDSATVREICQLAKANLAAINYHFGDKKRLYVEAIRQAHQWRLERMPLPNWPPGTPPEQKLGDFVRTLLTRMLAEGDSTWHTQLMLREISNPNPACEELVRDFIRPQFEILLSILDELLPPDVPAERRHLIAFSVVGQCLHYRVAGPVIRRLVPALESSQFTPELLGKHITQLTLAAVGRGPLVSSA